VPIANDKFTVFISHKHEDHELAVEVKKAIQGLNPKSIECFVSGVDITAGRDWRREIRSVLAKSHLLVLLFTAPSKNWDWCLFETGLYTRFDRTEVRSVVCLFTPGETPPSPLTDLQGIPAEADKIRDFLEELCRRTWEVSDDWRRGALAPEIASKSVKDAACKIAGAFCRSASASTYYPCHRLVLSLSEHDDITKGIPEKARVILGPNGTSGYTMSLFDLAGGTEDRTWGDLLRAVDGAKASWRRELDSHFLRALDEQLFSPMKSRMRCGGISRGEDRVYRPILYSIVRGKAIGTGSDDAAHADRRPRSVTIVLDPELLIPIPEAIESTFFES
jgi:hypothetical protein